MKRKILFLLPVILTLCLLPLWAMAEEYDIGNGSILVTADEQGQTVTQNDVAHRDHGNLHHRRQQGEHPYRNGGGGGLRLYYAAGYNHRSQPRRRGGGHLYGGGRRL